MILIYSTDRTNYKQYLHNTDSIFLFFNSLQKEMKNLIIKEEKNKNYYQLNIRINSNTISNVNCLLKKVVELPEIIANEQIMREKRECLLKKIKEATILINKNMFLLVVNIMKNVNCYEDIKLIKNEEMIYKDFFQNDSISLWSNSIRNISIKNVLQIKNDSIRISTVSEEKILSLVNSLLELSEILQITEEIIKGKLLKIKPLPKKLP